MARGNSQMVFTWTRQSMFYIPVQIILISKQGGKNGGWALLLWFLPSFLFLHEFFSVVWLILPLLTGPQITPLPYQKRRDLPAKPEYNPAIYNFFSLSLHNKVKCRFNTHDLICCPSLFAWTMQGHNRLHNTNTTATKGSTRPLII